MRLKACKLVCLLCVLVCSNWLYAQDNEVLWHNKERKLRYEPLPFGTWFIKKDNIDNRRFNRALYGTNTGFQVYPSRLYA